MAMVLRASRLRLTQAIYFGQPASVGSGTVTSVSQGNGIANAPNPIVGVGSTALGTLSSNHDFGNFRIDSANSVKWARAAEFATGGAGTSGNPWTSPTGTGGIQEAYNSLPAGVLGTVYAEAGYYSITSPINFSTNLATGIGSAAGTGGVIFMGDGSTNTILNGATKGQGGYPGTIGPVFDCTGASHVQFRDFAIITQGADKSSIGILFARSTAAFAQFSEDNEVRNVYMELLHDATANDGNGTVGIYGRAVEMSLFDNNLIIADHPYVFTGNDFFGVVSPNQPVNNTHVGTTVNTVHGGAALGYYDSVLLQGSVHNTTLSSAVFGKAAGSTSTHAIRVLNDSIVLLQPILDLDISGIQVETWTGVLSTTAPIFGMKLATSYGQDSVGTNPGVLLSGATAFLKNCKIHLVNGDNSTVQKLIGDGGAPTGGVVSCTIDLPAPLTINAPNTPASGNYVISEMAAPVITWAAGDLGQIIQKINSTAIGALVVSASAGLPAATGTHMTINPSGVSPVLGRIYVGDGTGWQLDFAKRTASTDTVLYSLLDTGAMQTAGVVPPAVSAANSGRIYFDAALNKYRVSMNGSAYVDLVGSGGITGSGIANKLAYWTSATNLVQESNVTLGGAYTLIVSGDINLTSAANVIRVGGTPALKVNAASNLTMVGTGGAVGNSTTTVGVTAGNVETGGGNTLVGAASGRFVTTGTTNVAVGDVALGNTTTGNNNVAVGGTAGVTNTTGSNNVFIGSSADAAVNNLTNAIAIGVNAIVGASNSMVLGGSGIKVGIHTSTPNAAFDVDGAIATRHKDVVLVNGTNSDIALADTSFIRITGPVGAFGLGGFTGGVDGRHLTVLNTTANAMTIVNLDGGSSATNQITTLTGGNVVLAARTSAASFVYEDASDTWVLVSTN